VQITPDSPLVDQTLAEAEIGELGVTVVAIFHGQSAQLTPGPANLLSASDVLLVAGREEQVQRLPGVTIGRETRATGYFTNPQVQMAEVVIAPRANVLGQTLKDIEFRRRYGVTAVAIWHEDKAYRTHVGDLPLHPGDALLVVGPIDRLEQLESNPAFIVVTPLGSPRHPPDPRKRRLSLGIAALVLGLSTAHWIPTSIAVLLGIVLLVLTKCLTMDEAMQSIEWKTIFVIAGLLPLNTAMQKTGLAATLGTLLVQTVGAYGFLPLIAGLFLGTMALTQVIGGQVAALVMAPIAIAAAAAIGVSPRAVGVVVAIACSAAFLTPLAHPVNLLMMGPGGYTFKDFGRIGLGLTVVCFVIILIGSPLLPGG
jgi:di/tricarboxylate transporter